MKYFYVFGLQRSGTNYFRSLLLENFEVQVANKPGTWWHYTSPPYSMLERHPSFVIYKNPYQWLESIIFRNRADLVETNINTYDVQCPDGYMVRGLNVNRLCKIYTDHTHNWKNSRFLTVKYEDLLDDDYLNNLFDSQKKTFERKSDVIIKPKQVFMSNTVKEKDLEYYKTITIKHLQQNDIDIINENIPDFVFNSLNYERIEKYE